MSRPNVIPAFQPTPQHTQGQELRSEQTVISLHEQGSFTYFLRLNNSETFVELVGARPLHLLAQTALPLKSPTGAFIAPLRYANADLPVRYRCTLTWILQYRPLAGRFSMR